MLVIAVEPSEAGPRWRGRRHDDDGPGAASGTTREDLFEAVFHALHDGEQVAVGLPAPLGADPGTTLETAEGERPAVRELAALLGELGHYRPWTVVSTSLPRWRATTSVLVWETASPDLDAAVEAFFTLVDGDRGAEDPHAEVVNLAAAAAVRAGLTCDEAQTGEPVVLVSVGS